jgi:hypothetical protein
MVERGKGMNTETAIANHETGNHPSGSGIAGKAQQAATTIGGQLEAAAEVVRERLPQEGAAGQVANALSDQLSGIGRYLQSHGLHGVVVTMGNVIRQYPVQSLLLGIGIGYLLSRLHTR